MPAIHRNTDARICGASTIVTGNSTVFANNLLVSVNGDPNTHGNGNLIAGSHNVYAHNILTVNNTPDSAHPDNKCHHHHNSHCSPKTAQGSPNVFTGD